MRNCQNVVPYSKHIEIIKACYCRDG